MGIPIKLEVFEGPLDLLMHLIEKNKIDIYDIPIVEITDQYMEYIHAMEREDLGIMSEFMVMAATLLDIKCRMLLPKEVNEDGEEEAARAELVEKLLEYKMYKFMSYELKDKMDEAANSFLRVRTHSKGGCCIQGTGRHFPASGRADSGEIKCHLQIHHPPPGG